MRALEEGQKSLAPLLIWTKDQSKMIESSVSMISRADQIFYCWIPPQFEAKKFYKDLEENNSNDVFLNLSLVASNLFFKTRFLAIDSAGLKFQIPSRLFKVQRRHNARFQIPLGHVLRVEFEDPVFPESKMRKSVIDISAGGMSFASPVEDLAIFVEGLLLKDFQFTLGLKPIQVSAEVKHAKIFKDRTGSSKVKVGVLFNEISEADRSVIASYVFDQTRKMFAKLF